MFTGIWMLAYLSQAAPVALSDMEYTSLFLVCGLILPLGFILLASRSRTSLKEIQGPPSSSWIYGW
jgi:hypothetical protein